MPNNKKREGLTEKELRDMLVAVLAGGAGIAGLSAILGAAKSKKEKAKILDVREGKGTIIVPFKKSKLMDGLVSPDEFERMYNERHSTPQIAYNSPQQDSSAVQEDIDAKKKSILAQSRGINYFKAAQANESHRERFELELGSDQGNSDEKDTKLDMRKSRAGEGVKNPSDNSSDQPRDELGRFASKDSDKNSGENKTTSEKSANALVDNVVLYPMGYVGAAFGMMWLAEKLASKINERRLKVAKNDLDHARDQYVSNLEEMGKTAEDDDGPGVLGTMGRAFGASFIIPLFFSAMIANRIMEKRYETKKKAKEEAGGIPDEPVVVYDVVDDVNKNPSVGDVPPGGIKMASDDDVFGARLMYKMADGSSIEVSAKSAMAAVLVKSAMIDAIIGGGTEKQAAEPAKENLMQRLARKGARLARKGARLVVNNNGGLVESLEPGVKGMMYTDGLVRTFNNGKATPETWNYLYKNPEYFRMVLQGVMRNGDASKSYYPNIDNAARYFEANGISRQDFANFLSSKELSDYLVRGFEYDPEMRKFRDNYVEDGIRSRFGSLNKQTGKYEDNFFSNIIQWLSRITGIGNWMFKKNVASRLGDMSKKVYTGPQTTVTRAPSGVDANKTPPAETPPVKTPLNQTQAAGGNNTNTAGPTKDKIPGATGPTT
jgi:hypothetical protein